MNTQNLKLAPVGVGYWQGDASDVQFSHLDAETVPDLVRESVHVVFDPTLRCVGVTTCGEISSRPAGSGYELPLLGTLPPTYPEWLGDRSFKEAHGLRFPYVGGAMARGISSTELVIALANMGALGMIGAAGVNLSEIEAAIDRMSKMLDKKQLPWGCNLIHSPNEAKLEDAIADLYVKRGVRRVSVYPASTYGTDIARV
ncbi:MAG: nitronate monooxygenase [Gammaproteobacteria bacterium]|nr:nitronate monooxygenase [Gammaproteobacteria bacterium]MDP6734215.1 nitronate monooxygenase [Gammaproteobacteria bacterium]